MKLIAKLFVVGALALAGACDDGGSDGVANTTDNDATTTADTSGGTSTGDATTVTTATDTATVEDTAVAADTVVPQDSLPSDTTVADAADTSVAEDTSVADTSVSEDTTPISGNGACMMPPVFGEPTHITSIVIPSSASAFNCDSDNDGTIDADDGDINTSLAGLSGFFDANQAIAEALADGDISLGADFNGKATDPTDFWVNMYVGNGPVGDCNDVDAQMSGGEVVSTSWNGTMCPFEIDADSFDTDGCPVITIPGAAMTGNQFAAGPVPFNFSIPLGGLQLNVAIENGRLLGTTADAVSISNGRLCGEIPKTVLNAAIDQACSEEGAPDFCSFKDLIKSLINCKSDAMCSIVIALESGQASSMTVE